MLGLGGLSSNASYVLDGGSPALNVGVELSVPETPYNLFRSSGILNTTHTINITNNGVGLSIAYF